MLEKINFIQNLRFNWRNFFELNLIFVNVSKKLFIKFKNEITKEKIAINQFTSFELNLKSVNVSQ
jgi:hypothetical protein